MKQFFRFSRASVAFIFLLIALLFPSCKKSKKVYTSTCNVNLVFKKVKFTQLIDSIDNYDHQYIEIAGVYKEAKGQSALFSDSLFVDHSNKHGLWINFSQDCPLYLNGTHIGLFEASDGQFVLINNKKVVIRGKIDLHNRGHLAQYAGSLDRISFIKL
jgi:hypothetical protein